MDPLKLIEALEINQKRVPESAEVFRVLLACGFTPLHLEPLLEAHRRLRLPPRGVQINSGLFGDLAGNVGRAAGDAFDAIVVIAKSPDFDPRLGFRNLGSWSPEHFSGILSEVRSRSAQLERVIRETANRAAIVVCLPTLPFPPLASSKRLQASFIESQIELSVTERAGALVEIPGARLVNRQYLDRVSPTAQRYDVDSDLRFGFP